MHAIVSQAKHRRTARGQSEWKRCQSSPKQIRGANPVPQLFNSSFARLRSEAYIATGLAIFIASIWWLSAPVVTAMAITCLGATDSQIARVRANAGRLPNMIAHGAVYAGLYGLIIG